MFSSRILGLPSWLRPTVRFKPSGQLTGKAARLRPDVNKLAVHPVVLRDVEHDHSGARRRFRREWQRAQRRAASRTERGLA